MDRAIANTSFYAWVKGEPLADWLVAEWRCRTIDVRVISFHPVDIPTYNLVLLVSPYFNRRRCIRVCSVAGRMAICSLYNFTTYLRFCCLLILL